MLVGLAWKKIGTSDAVEDIGNLDQDVSGVAVGLLQIAGELGAEMADPARREARSQGERRGFGGNLFLAVVADGVVTGLAGSRKTLFAPQ
jgi:hypothetical protein